MPRSRRFNLESRFKFIDRHRFANGFKQPWNCCVLCNQTFELWKSDFKILHAKFNSYNRRDTILVATFSDTHSTPKTYSNNKMKESASLRLLAFCSPPHNKHSCARTSRRSNVSLRCRTKTSRCTECVAWFLPFSRKQTKSCEQQLGFQRHSADCLTRKRPSIAYDLQRSFATYDRWPCGFGETQR